MSSVGISSQRRQTFLRAVPALSPSRSSLSLVCVLVFPPLFFLDPVMPHISVLSNSDYWCNSHKTQCFIIWPAWVQTFTWPLNKEPFNYTWPAWRVCFWVIFTLNTFFIALCLCKYAFHALQSRGQTVHRDGPLWWIKEPVLADNEP